MKRLKLEAVGNEVKLVSETGSFTMFFAPMMIGNENFTADEVIMALKGGGEVGVSLLPRTLMALDEKLAESIARTDRLVG